MIPRTLAPKLQAAAGPFPVLFLTGPRQSGKTTLSRSAFPDYEYISLEDPQNRALAHEDPVGLLRRVSGARGVIFDEVQRTPGLFPYLQGIVDDRRGGPFVLTGSQNFLLSERITQSLAGRVAVFELLPLSVAELERRAPLDPDTFVLGRPVAGDGEGAAAGEVLVRSGHALDDVMFAGMYPAVHDRGIEPGLWHRSYTTTYVERDARAAGSIGDLDAFLRFVGLCAGRSGQLLNLSSLGADAGVTHTTARSWLSVLRASYIVMLLAPHHENFNKRIVKTPKLYFLDTGLLCSLLGIRAAGDLWRHPLRGAVFETLVVSELVKLFTHNGERPRLYFWRDSGGVEVDVLMDLGAKRIPIEAKAGATITADAFRGLDAYGRLALAAQDRGSVADAAARVETGSGVVVYGGDERYVWGGREVRPWWSCT